MARVLFVALFLVLFVVSGEAAVQERAPAFTCTLVSDMHLFAEADVQADCRKCLCFMHGGTTQEGWRMNYILQGAVQPGDCNNGNDIADVVIVGRRFFVENGEDCIHGYEDVFVQFTNSDDEPLFFGSGKGAVGVGFELLNSVCCDNETSIGHISAPGSKKRHDLKKCSLSLAYVSVVPRCQSNEAAAIEFNGVKSCLCDRRRLE